METVYRVVSPDGTIKGTFVFQDDAEEFIRTKEPLCHIAPLEFSRTRIKEKKTNDRANTL